MTLIILTVVVIALLIAVLAVYFFTIGALLNRIAENLGDCAQSVKNVRYQAEAIGPAVVRINRTGRELVGALPLLHDCAQRVGAEPAVAGGAPSGLGYMDA